MYVNVIIKPVIIKKSIIRRELVEKVHQVTKINPNEHQIHLTCKWPVAYEYYQAVGISYDDDNVLFLK